MFFRKPSDHVPHVTIFHTILRSMLWILFIEIALLVGILYLCRINTSIRSELRCEGEESGSRSRR